LNQSQEAIIHFLRTDPNQEAEENEEYAIVYVRARGQDKFLSSSPEHQLTALKRTLFPLYLLPAGKRDGYFLADPLIPLSITCFDDFNPALLVSQFNYLISPNRSALRVNGKLGQELFDYISGSLMDFTNLLNEFDANLSSTIGKEFVDRAYSNFVESVKPLITAPALRRSSYHIDVSEKLSSACSFEDALNRLHRIEENNSFLVEFFHRCLGLKDQLSSRVKELEEHTQASKAILTEEFEAFKNDKEKEIAKLSEDCETQKQSLERTYKPLITKAEKQFKAAKEANEAAQLELMPVQNVYDDLSHAMSKLEDWIKQCASARDEAERLAEDFKTKYVKLQESQSNLQIRSSKSDQQSEKPVPEDAPLDAQMAYLERQALSYESKAKQLEEEMNKSQENLARVKAELEKFEPNYRPIKNRADEAKANLENKESELNGLRNKRVNEIEMVEQSCREEVAKIKAQIEAAGIVFAQRLPALDGLLEGTKSSFEKLKADIDLSVKYADDTIEGSLQRLILTTETRPPATVYYPVYVAKEKEHSKPMFIVGGLFNYTSTPPKNVTIAAHPLTSTPTAGDSYFASKCASLNEAHYMAEYNLLDQFEFKGRVLAGLKALTKKGFLSESRMLRLAKEVAIVGLKET
jgi:hypothetical protein